LLSQEQLEAARQDPEISRLLLEQKRRRVRGSLLGWCTEVLEPIGQKPATHHRLIITKLEAVARGEIDRLMIYAPPGSAKSTYATVLFPTWWFTQHPRSAIISASHTGDLAESFGRRVRNTADANSELLGYTLSADSRAAGKWDTDSGGEYLAAGVGKAIAGRRADLAVIDDPVASRESAESLLERERTYNWYRGDLYDRLKPGARVILIMTRWHEDDLGGRLDADELEGGDKWHRILLPALAEHADDPLGREMGAALWPEWEDERMLARKRRVVGEREWIAKYQQRPAPQEGAIFNPDQMGIIEMIPVETGEEAIVHAIRYNPISRSLRSFETSRPADFVPKRVRAWDLASTAAIGTRDPDWTVGLLMRRTMYKRYIVENIVRERLSPQGTETLIRTCHEADDLDITYNFTQDPGQAGKAQIAALTRICPHRRISWQVASGDKATRAWPVASQVNVGNVSMLRAGWNTPLRDELANFPNGVHDDQVDAFSAAYEKLLPPKERRDEKGRFRRLPPTFAR
jgi:predicted phage terminase large subunit-like protein